MITELMNGLRTEECDRMILLIRHGEKVQPPVENPFKDVGLTDNGASMSFHMGEELLAFGNQNEFEIHSSPLKRCIETAENILRGLGIKNQPMVTSSILGNPGPYVEDDNLAGKTFTSIASQNRSARLIEMQLDHRSLPGFRDLEEGSKAILKHLFERCGKKLCVAVTHDTTILPLIGFLYEGAINIEEGIEYLDGVLFCIKERKITMHTREISNFDISYALKEMKIL